MISSGRRQLLLEKFAARTRRPGFTVTPFDKRRPGEALVARTGLSTPSDRGFAGNLSAWGADKPVLVYRGKRDLNPQIEWQPKRKREFRTKTKWVKTRFGAGWRPVRTREPTPETLQADIKERAEGFARVRKRLPVADDLRREKRKKALRPALSVK